MIANIFWLSIFWLAVLMAGHIVVSNALEEQRRHRSEEAALVLGLGSGIVALLLFWASLIGFKPSRGVLIFLLILFAAGEAYLFIRGRWSLGTRSENGVQSGFSRACMIGSIAVILGCLCLVTLNALGLPIYEWDAFAVWGLKAKVLALDPLSPSPEYFQNASLSFSHLDYPLLVPFLTAGVYGAIGSINDQLGKIVFPVLYLGFGFQLFSALRWKLGRDQSFLLTAVAMSVPTLVRWAGGGVADVVLISYYFAAIFYCLRWLEAKQWADLLFSILFSAFAVFTKNEGLALVALIFCAMAGIAIVERTRLSLTSSIWFAGGVVALNAPWFWWSRTIPNLHENYPARLRPSILVENWDRVGMIAAEFFKQTWMWSRWGGVWLVLLVSAIAGYRALSQRRTKVLWLLFGAQLAMYLMILIVTPWNVRELLDVALDRVILQTMPVVILLIGFHWHEAACHPELVEHAATGERRVDGQSERG